MSNNKSDKVIYQWLHNTTFQAACGHNVGKGRGKVGVCDYCRRRRKNASR